MNGVWAALCWKEWREHRWKALTVTVIGLVVVGWLWRAVSGVDASAAATLYCFLVIPAAGLFVASGIAAAELANGTAAFARSLPCGGWRAAVTKLFAAVVTVTIPASLALPLTIQDLSDVPVYLLAIVSFVLWCATLGMNRTDEIRASALAILGVVVAWALFVIVANWIEPANSREFLPLAVAAAAIPGGVFLASSGGPIAGESHGVGMVAVALSYFVAHGALLWRWLAGYGAMPQTGSTTGSLYPSAAKLLPPHPSMHVAIVWKQLSETVPVALAALGLAAAWLLVAFVGGSGIPEEAGQTLGVGAAIFGVLSGATAFLAALVAGIGLFLEDLRPKVHAFWRSRPIPPDTWFWWQYGAGLLCLFLIFGGVQLLCSGVWMLAAPDYDEGPRVPYLASGIAFWMTYSTAACACCLARQPVYAAILAIGVCVWPPGLLASWLAERGLPDDVVVSLLTALFCGIAIVTTLLAWQSVRRDWVILR